MITDSL